MQRFLDHFRGLKFTFLRISIAIQRIKNFNKLAEYRKKSLNNFKATRSIKTLSFDKELIL